MFNKRVKARPSLRARDSDLDTSSPASPLGKSVITANVTADEDESGTSGSVLERKKAQKKDKRLSGLKSSGSTRLSFGGEGEEGEGFKTRKSLLSQSIKLPTQSPGYVDLGSSGISSYSREYLSELKASTPTRAPRSGGQDEDEDIEGSELAGDIEMEDGTGISRLARDKYASEGQKDSTAGIPDAAAVASARMKRQAKVESARHGDGEEEDYIALGGGKLIVRDGRVGDGPHPESRLMREEDEGEEYDEGESAVDCLKRL